MPYEIRPVIGVRGELVAYLLVLSIVYLLDISPGKLNGFAIRRQLDDGKSFEGSPGLFVLSL